METGTLIPVQEYLGSSYHPDREYIDGFLLERNLGERDHSELQTELAIYLGGLRRKLGIHVFVEQRIQVSRDRFRVPDLCVVAGLKPPELIFHNPPFLCIEILSKNDRVEEMQERIQDYLAFGVPYVWLINPRTRWACSYTSGLIMEASDRVLRTESPEIIVRLDDVFETITAG